MSVSVLTGFERRITSFSNDVQEIYYPETDGIDMGQNEIHFWLINNITQMLQLFLENRKDAHVSGDVMFYFEEGKPKTFVAPDVMICFGLDKQPRKIYQLWKEKVVPSVVIEIVSESTWERDITQKFALYQRLGVGEYYIYDPEREYLHEPLMAFHLKNDEFEKIEAKDGKIFSPSLDLELIDDGFTLRFYNYKEYSFLPTARELANKNRIAELEIEKLKKEIEELKAKK